ncbi:flagellar assembly protein FliH [Bacillus shivajii]|uniref:flagellar assembly protein FliH n=1 Tax=Bacillus shivajii TaxID=1983719 RepID=UPI001CFB6D7C|nr:flagellar assembly protein FliH [Bacillus shivajii]UCZ51726.1 flagellar assembly protein FliH [Bacillus shivajii]
MSKLIKSAYANKLEDSVKTIGVRRLYTNNDENDPSIEHDEMNEQAEQQYSGKQNEVERENILLEAKQQAEELIEEAQLEIDAKKKEIAEYENNIAKEAEVRFEKAKQAGEKEGYEAGLIKGKQAYDQKIVEAQKIIDQAKQDYISKIGDSQSDMLDLSLNIAEKIIGKTIDEDPDAFLQLVKEAVTEVREQEEVKIYVPPNCYERTLKNKREIKEIALNTRQLYIYPDASINEDSCIIETPFGKIDASIDSQLTEMKTALHELLKSGDQHEHS